MGKERIIAIDHIKGIAIICVVIGHIVQHNNIFGGDYNPVHEFVQSFHLALFFMASGFLTALKNSQGMVRLKSLFAFLKNKSMTLVLPFLTWGLIVNEYFFAESIVPLSFQKIIKYIKYPGDIWFLEKLFEIYVIYAISSLLSNIMTKGNRYYDVLLVVCSLVINMVLVLSVDKIHYVSVLLFNMFFYTGYFIRRIQRLYNLLLNEKVYFISIILFCFLATHWSYQSLIIDKALKIVISISAFIMFFNISLLIQKSQFVSSELCKWGKYSLAIYLIHFHFVNIGQSMSLSGNVNSMLLALIVFFCAMPIIYVCIFIAKLIESSKILKLLLFGK